MAKPASLFYSLVLSDQTCEWSESGMVQLCQRQHADINVMKSLQHYSCNCVRTIVFLFLKKGDFCCHPLICTVKTIVRSLHFSLTGYVSCAKFSDEVSSAWNSNKQSYMTVMSKSRTIKICFYKSSCFSNLKLRWWTETCQRTTTNCPWKLGRFVRKNVLSKLALIKSTPTSVSLKGQGTHKHTTVKWAILYSVFLRVNLDCRAFNLLTTFFLWLALCNCTSCWLDCLGWAWFY